MSATKESWNSRLGIVMAVAGSAVGLGNFIRFPGLVAQSGGGAFLIAYFVSLLLLGLPMSWMEWTLGRMGGAAGYNSAPGIFQHIAGRRVGRLFGIIGVTIPVCIFMYYTLIEAWCLAYAVQMATGGVDFSSGEETRKFFAALSGVEADGSAIGAIGWSHAAPYLVLVILLNFTLVYHGISKGIERFCNWAMPLLVVVGIIILVRVLTLGTPDSAKPENNVINGLGFMWNPVKIEVVERSDGPSATETRTRVVDPTLIAAARERAAADPSHVSVIETGPLQSLRDPGIWLAAASQVFFSLSIGFGVILTYASYLRRNQDVVLSSTTAVAANEFCEVGIGGLLTVPATVAFLGTSAVVASSFGLGFNVLPRVFAEMQGGAVFGSLFFLLLFLAAATSSISMLQPGIAFLEEASGAGRRISVAVLGLITVLGCGFVAFFSKDLKALDTLDKWAGNFLIFIVATATVIFFGWYVGARRGIEEANRDSAMKLPLWIAPILKWICPAFLTAIFILWIASDLLGFNFHGDAPGVLSGYVTDLVGGTDAQGRPVEPSLVARLTVLLILALLLFFAVVTAASRRYKKPSNPPSP